jgi:phosphoglycerate dehydrogenase-like enzyme
MLASPVLFTNSAGVHAPPMAETVLAMILFFGRGLDLAVRSQRLGRWDKDAFYRAGAPVGELAGATVGIVGFGGVGREVARRVVALGARVIALVRDPPRAGLANLEALVGEGRLGERIDVLHGEGGLDTVLRASDILVIAAPETADTRGMIDAQALERMKEGALLVNVARGKLVDEAALVRSLESGRLRGAGLDVFAREPLPQGHPLWSLPNALITPHVSAVTRSFWDRETALMTENVRRYLGGETLLNLVNKQAGY